MSDIPPVIAWFRNDLRVGDNAMLQAAIETGQPIIPLYILDPTLGGAARWWLHFSLTALSRKLGAMGSRLVLRSGKFQDIILDLIKDTGSNTLFWNRCYDGTSIKRDTALKQSLTDKGVIARSFNGSLLQEPWHVQNKSGEPFSVFTPFWRHVRALDPGPVLPTPNSLSPGPSHLRSDHLADWHLTPTAPNWATGFPDAASVGEDAAHLRLDEFLDVSLSRYAKQRDMPAESVSSRLSPHLHWGEISPRQIWTSIENHRHRAAVPESGAEKFLSEIGWREFSYHLLYRYPEIANEPIRPEFSDFPWRPDKSLLLAWQQGRTGFSLVDAGMRELWSTGSMHNRVRMVTASFLIKHLLQPWQQGAAWFMDTLIDADIAANSANWQWVAGCGADAAPYFRIFNPILQGEKFDPDGDYVRRWVPERRHLDKAAVHNPISPIVDHDYARRRALDALSTMKNASG